MHAWEAWGDACVTRFRGMFAFALWDANAQTLFLARDRLGVKPLHYACLPDGTVVFGSELKSLLTHPAAAARRSTRLRGRGVFRAGLRRRAAHDLRRRAQAAAGAHADDRARRGRCRCRVDYWDVRFTLAHRAPRADASEELRARLDESVRLRMIAEVPLGAFLSGGVDSSAVVAIDGRRSRRVRSIRVRSRSPTRPSTSRGTRTRSRDRYGTRHFVERVESDDFELIDTLARLYDEPYADSSAIPTYRVCQLARKHVTVALSGDGGDESFGGYRRYRLHLMEERMRAVAARWRVRRPVFGLLGRAVSEGGLGAARVPRQVDVRGAAATRSTPISTACRSCATTCAGACSRDAFRSAARRLQRRRGVPPSCEQGRHRRPAGADPVSRPARHISSATSTPRSTGRAWRTRSRCASR